MPLVFDIVFEPVAQAARQNTFIFGIFVGKSKHQITLYADDILIYLAHPWILVPCLIRVISSFPILSGYKINFAISEAMHLGSLKGVSDVAVPFPFRWSPGFAYWVCV